MHACGRRSSMPWHWAHTSNEPDWTVDSMHTCVLAGTHRLRAMWPAPPAAVQPGAAHRAFTSDAVSPFAGAGLEFVKAMWGCLFADIVAVPVCPPDPTRLHTTLAHFNRIVEDCGAAAILTDRSFHMVRAQERRMHARGPAASCIAPAESPAACTGRTGTSCVRSAWSCLQDAWLPRIHRAVPVRAGCVGSEQHIGAAQGLRRW